MTGKGAMRMTPNTNIYLEDVFVPTNMRLTKATDFQNGTNKLLTSSRIQVAFSSAGAMAGSYEAALKYTKERQQFGKPLAKF